MLLALHTWGRSLSFHPHVHALVTEGGLDPSGRWREPVRRSFLPARVVMRLFRGKFRARLLDAVRAGKLRPPAGESARRLENLLNRLGRIPWNVRVQERYGHGVGVATYLARYVRGGPLRNSQIHRVSEDEVCYRYRSHRSDEGGRGLHTVHTTPEGFIGRYLAHVPALRKKTIRVSGLYASSKRGELACARAALGAPPPPNPAPAPLDWRVFLERLGTGSAPRCKRCGAPVHQAEPVPRVHDPPGPAPGQGR